jgi:hypothetical protein
VIFKLGEQSLTLLMDVEYAMDYPLEVQFFNLPESFLSPQNTQPKRYLRIILVRQIITIDNSHSNVRLG